MAAPELTVDALITNITAGIAIAVGVLIAYYKNKKKPPGEELVEITQATLADSRPQKAILEELRLAVGELRMMRLMVDDIKKLLVERANELEFDKRVSDRLEELLKSEINIRPRSRRTPKA